MPGKILLLLTIALTTIPCGNDCILRRTIPFKKRGVQLERRVKINEKRCIHEGRSTYGTGTNYLLCNRSGIKWKTIKASKSRTIYNSGQHFFNNTAHVDGIYSETSHGPLFDSSLKPGRNLIGNRHIPIGQNSFANPSLKKQRERARRTKESILEVYPKYRSFRNHQT